MKKLKRPSGNDFYVTSEFHLIEEDSFYEGVTIDEEPSAYRVAVYRRTADKTYWRVRESITRYPVNDQEVEQVKPVTVEVTQYERCD